MIPIYLIAIGVSWGTYRMFKEADAYLRKEKKKELTKWLLSQKDSQNSIINPFLEIFDKIFSKKHFSKRCFFVSAILSVLIFSITYFVYYKINYDNVADFDLAGIDILLDILPFIVVFTIIPDYISLLETRFILGIMDKTDGVIKKLLLLLADFIFTFIIIAVFLTIGTKIGHNYLMSDLYFFDFMESWYSIPVQDRVEFQGTPKATWKMSFPFSVFVYSAFFTSFWIWIYLIAALTIKLVFLPKSVIKLTLKYFDIRKNPLSVIGGAISLILLLLSFLFLGVIKLIPDHKEVDNDTNQQKRNVINRPINSESLENRYPNIFNSNYYTTEQVDTLKLYDELYIYLSELKSDSIINDVFDLQGVFNLNKEILLLDYQMAFNLNDTLGYRHKMALVNGKSYSPLYDDPNDKRWQKMSTYFKKEEWKEYSLLRIVQTRKFKEEENKIKQFMESSLITNQGLKDELNQIRLYQRQSQLILVRYLDYNAQKLNPKNLGFGLKIENCGLKSELEKYRKPSRNVWEVKQIILKEIRKI